MHTGEISFCDKICFNIKSDVYKKQILDELENICGFKIIQKHHENYKDSFLHVIKSKPYMVSVKSNGNPYLLYLTRYDGANQCIFIDKKIQKGYFYPRMIVSKLRFDDVLFDGTIFDGEMVKGDQWLFIINDIYSCKAQTTYNMDLVDRVNLITNILEQGYVEEDISCCDLQIKRYFTYSQYEELEEFVDNLPYTSRGLYFKPYFMQFRDILVNFNDDLIKKIKNDDNFESKTFKQIVVEPVETNAADNVVDSNTNINNKTVILFGKKTIDPDVYELYETLECRKYISYACVMKMNTSIFLRKVFQNTNINQKIGLVCVYNQKYNRWTPTEVF